MADSDAWYLCEQRQVYYFIEIINGQPVRHYQDGVIIKTSPEDLKYCCRNIENLKLKADIWYNSVPRTPNPGNLSPDQVPTLADNLQNLSIQAPDTGEPRYSLQGGSSSKGKHSHHASGRSPKEEKSRYAEAQPSEYQSGSQAQDRNYNPLLGNQAASNISYATEMPNYASEFPDGGADEDPYQNQEASSSAKGKQPRRPPRTSKVRKLMTPVDENSVLQQGGPTPLNLEQGPLIQGTKREKEKLDPNYYKRPSPKKFFKLGRVFAVLWHENRGDNSRPGHGPNGSEWSTKSFQLAPYGEPVYSSIRRMVVVREGEGCCWCLPISTYGGQGTLKPGLNPELHAIIHMEDQPPQRRQDETQMTKEPIQVRAAGPEQKLDRMSRLNFGKVYTIEHNVKVANVGKVNEMSMPKLVSYWNYTVAS
ncbi:MAG: hypothetical protein M1834_002778 [Cirrosporium novae-zelandiae]|nr:MAG: hypothetical protein M1834_002778 [Cirrosporium novae-zelandiae]